MFSLCNNFAGTEGIWRGVYPPAFLHVKGFSPVGQLTSRTTNKTLLADYYPESSSGFSSMIEEKAMEYRGNHRISRQSL